MSLGCTSIVLSVHRSVFIGLPSWYFVGVLSGRGISVYTLLSKMSIGNMRFRTPSVYCLLRVESMCKLAMVLMDMRKLW